MAGAYSFNRLYTRHLENTALAHAEQRAAQLAQQAFDERMKNQGRAKPDAHQQTNRGKEYSFSTQLDAARAKIKPASPATLIAPLKHAIKAIPSRYIPAPNSKIIALVIDDIGYKRQEGQRVLALPGKLTVAVLPFTPYAKILAMQAPSEGKEVMLHAPMEPKNLNRWGDGLMQNMSEDELRTNFVNMIDAIPNLVGINNHMGSELTENARIMQWLMAELPERGLYFIDSRTTADSMAFNIAQKLGIPSYERDIFLDHSRKPIDINRQFDKLIQTANKGGMALGIGHPYPETMAVLEARLPELHKQGIELVTVSELLNAREKRQHLAQQITTSDRTPL
jgi:polysaccharide deacetylase 2 family uncharacterized protein YibQ